MGHKRNSPGCQVRSCCCSLTGTVRGPGGLVVPGAVVQIKNSSTLAVLGTATSGADGTYSIPVATAGVNAVATVAYGGQTMTRPGVFSLACGQVINWCIGRRVGFAAKGLESQYLDAVSVVVSGGGTTWSGTASGVDNSPPPYFTPNDPIPFVVDLLPGVYSYTLSRSRFQTLTASLTVNGLCPTTPFTAPGLTPASPYVHYPGFNIPISPTLVGTIAGHVYTLSLNAFGGYEADGPVSTAPGGCCPAFVAGTGGRPDSGTWAGDTNSHLHIGGAPAGTFPPLLAYEQDGSGCPQPAHAPDGAGSESSAGVTSTLVSNSEAPAFSIVYSVQSLLYRNGTTDGFTCTVPTDTLIITE